MKSLRRIALVITVCLTVVLSSFVMTDAKEAFDILSHNIDVVVHENGELDIIETMKVHFTEERHGIYVNIPEKYTMEWNNYGQKITKDYFFPIKDMKMISNHKCETEKDSDVARFIIGDENQYANAYETYVYRYTMVTRDLDMNGLQMVFLNLITSGWDTTTDKCTFNITFPKTFDASNIYTASPEGTLRGTGDYGALRVSVTGNRISGSYNAKLNSDDALTIQVVLPDDYFQFTNLKKYAGIGMIAAGIVTGILTIVFLIFGKDDPVIVTAEYHTPADLDSAQVGVIINEQVNDRDVMSLLLDWGRRGIITIEETEDDLFLTAINTLEVDAKEYEKVIYEGLFKEEKHVAVSSLKDSFYTTFNEAKSKLESYYKDSVRALSTKSSKVASIISIIFCWLPVGISSAIIALNYYWDDMWAISLAISAIFIVCCGVLAQQYGMNVYVSDRKEKIAMIIGILAFFAAPAIMLAIFCYLVKASPFTYISIVLLQIIVLIEVAHMRKRTIYGNSMLGRVLGLKEFIVNASENTIAEQLENNPYYFYDILPYAYALDLTDIWNEHFKNMTVTPCDWYVPYGSTYVDHYHRMHSMSSHMSSITSSMVSSPSSDSSGGGFSGGGGFGGSSGGSW